MAQFQQTDKLHFTTHRLNLAFVENQRTGVGAGKCPKPCVRYKLCSLCTSYDFWNNEKYLFNLWISILFYTRLPDSKSLLVLHVYVLTLSVISCKLQNAVGL